MYRAVRRTKFIGSLTSGHATTLNSNGTPKAGISARHCRFSNGSNNSGANEGLMTSVSPTATPASHWWLTLPSSSHRKNSTSHSRMQPLMFVNTRVLVTLSVQNIASSSAGAATEASVNLNRRSSR